MFNKIQSFLVFTILFLIISCNGKESQSDLQLIWEEENIALPEGVVIYKGFNKSLPVKAWVIKVNHNAPRIDTRILVSRDSDKRETVAEFAQHSEAFIVVNGGYFLTQKNPSNHVGLLMVDGELIEPASESVIRTGLRYPVARGAFGIDENGQYDIAWASTRNDSLFEWVDPIRNEVGDPDTVLDFSHAKFWDMHYALHAGPVLVHDGKMHVYTTEEVFFGTKIPQVHPRTAIGYTKGNDLIIAVVDGRQPESRGASLDELAQIMIYYDCIEALNLDGGGSSSMWVNGTLLNRPSGNNTMREIMSSVAIFYNED